MSKLKTMCLIDIEYDFREDSECGDPDKDSHKLYDAHKLLWSKALPNNISFNFIKTRSSGRLLLKNDLTSNLSSDRMCPHFVGKYKGKFDKWTTKTERGEFKRKVRTIGGHIVFPAHRKCGFTINQARGVSPKIGDRFDLTLECIRRFYKGEQSPLYETLKRYSEFLNIFIDFNTFIEFFLLQDFLNESGQVVFTIPFDNFKRQPLPQTSQEYKSYRSQIIKQIDKRNLRILREIR